MSLENELVKIELKDARLKPYGILQMIAEKFGFKMGIPEHKFKEDNWQTDIKMSHENKTLDATCCISLSEYNDVPTYFYEYLGPVISKDDGKENILTASYSAHVIQQFTGCFGVHCSGLMIIRDKETPHWFPAEDRE